MENEKLKDYFTRYPNNDEVFENNDVLFHNRGAADSFGNAKETVRHTRAKVMESPINSPAVDVKNEDTDTTKTAAVELLKNADVETLDYNAMKALVKDLELTTADKKSETLKIALTEFKKSLNAE